MHDYEAQPQAKYGIVLPGERVDLVALGERHLPLIIAWRNNPAIRDRFFNRRIFTSASEIDWFSRYVVDPNTFCFAIVLKTGRSIGTLAISKIDWRARTGEFGRFLIGDPLSLGRGFGREAAALAIDFAKSWLRLTSISLGVMPENTAAVKLYRNLGFVEAETRPRATSDGGSRLQMRMTLALDLEDLAGSPESDSVPA